MEIVWTKLDFQNIYPALIGSKVMSHTSPSKTTTMANQFFELTNFNHLIKGYKGIISTPQSTNLFPIMQNIIEISKYTLIVFSTRTITVKTFP